MKDFELYWRITPDDALPEMVQERGGELARIWKESGSSNIEKQKLGFIPWTKICAMHEFTAKDLDDPYTGLKLAYDHSEDFHSFGPMVFIMRRSNSMREFIEMALQYQKLHTNGFSIETDEDIERQEFTMTAVFHPNSGPYRQCLEHLFGLLSMYQSKLIPGNFIKHISFQHRAPAEMTWYEKLFPDVPIEFNAPRNTIVGDLGILGVKRKAFLSKALEKAVAFHLKRQIRRHPFAHKTMAASISEILPSLVTCGTSSIENTATILDMHPKKLQRLLSDEGTSYREILDDVRRAQAIRLLEDSDIRVGAVAQILNYSTDRAFNAAFQRWFGMSPAKYRKAMAKT